MYRVVITKYKNKILFSYQEDNIPVELKLFSYNPCPVGSVFFGRVSDVKTNIGASFVDLDGKIKGFLPGTDHKEGEMVTVQIERDGDDIKNPRLSEDISIAGEYCVVYLKAGSFKASSKLTGESKQAVLSGLKQEFPNNRHMAIVRTNAANCDFKVLCDEIAGISEIIDNIEKYAEYRTKSMLYKSEDEWIRAIKNIYLDRLDEIVTDDTDIYERLTTLGYEVRLYDDKLLPLIKLYSLETRLKEATSKKVWLKCGGYLFIEPTEALVSIDVNSGKITSGRNKEETILRVNLEAADEIARQMRLRNLSGIIIVDFINMTNASNDAELLKHLREEVALDPIKTQVHGMTSLGLVEITRMKGLKTLYEQSRFVSDDAVVSGD